MTLSGIIFDFDGVLFDSEKHWARLENPYLHKYIPTWQDEDYAKLVGRSLPEVHQFLVHAYNFSVPSERYFADYEDMAVRLYSRLAKPLPKVRRLLDALSEDELKVAIASSSKPAWIESALAAYNLRRYFPVIVTAHDEHIQRGKPAPDVYLDATERLGQNRTQIIAIEDSHSGISSAKAAGIFCVGLRNGDNNDQDLSGADVIVDGYEPITVDYLKGLLG